MIFWVVVGVTPPWLSTELVNAAEGSPVCRVPNSVKDAKEEKIGKEQLSTGLKSLCKCVCVCGGPVSSEYLVTNVRSN